MGQLVFQATLGGAVNLIGPNTASTINFTLPSADGTSGQALATNGTGTLAFSSFATLVSNTFTGSQTLSAGTANGVTYLNGSKVLTSGSVLQFDGTNLLVGTTTSLSGQAGRTDLTVNGSSTAIVSLGVAGARQGYFYTPSVGAILAAENGTLSLSTTSGQAIVFNTNNAQKAIIESSGNFGIGTSSPASKLDVNGVITALGGNSPTGGFNLRNVAGTVTPRMTNDAGDGTVIRPGASSASVKFNNFANTTELAQITDAGNLLVGTTTASGKLFSSTSSASQPALRAASTSATYNDNVFAIDVDRNTTNNTFYVISYYNNGAAAHKFRVADSGNVTNTNNSYGAISDVKLKENIVDATPKLSALQNVRIVNYNRIGSEEKELGVIAQELEQVFPALVETHIDRDAEGNDLGTTTKSVKYSVFVPMLIKALQEQQAIIESLKARLDAANL